MKVLLVNPPFNRLKRVKGTYFPIGLGYLAAVLERAGHTVSIWNGEMPREEILRTPHIQYERTFAHHEYYRDSLRDGSHPAWKEAREIIQQHSPDMVGITTMSPNFPSALKIAVMAKSAYPRCQVVMGGPHPTILPDEVMENDFVDFLVRGEGEETIIELIKALEEENREFAGIRGISYRNNGQVVHNPGRALLHQLDSLPFPARHLVCDSHLYTPEEMGVLFSGRGCPFDCGFCSSKDIWTKRVRYRSVENVIKEIEEVIQRHSTRDFYFWDDALTISKRRVMALCSQIIKKGIKIRWTCETRVDLVDDELLAAMRKAGCNNIYFGIESGSQKVLDQMNKGITIEQCRRAIRLATKHGIRVGAFLMFGLPEETEEDIQKTIDLAKRLRVASLRFSVFTPYPGSSLFTRARQLGLIPEKINWENYDLKALNPENHFVKYIDKNKFQSYVKTMCRIVDAQNNKNPILREWPFFARNPDILLEKIKGKLMNALGIKSWVRKPAV